MLKKMNEAINMTKIELIQKNDELVIKVPRVRIHEINPFGLVHLIFSTEMYSRLKNETGDIHERTRRLETLEDPLDLIK